MSELIQLGAQRPKAPAPDQLELRFSDKAIAELRALQRNSQAIDTRHPAMATMKIANVPAWMQAFSTHPPLEKRIEALQRGQ